MQIRLLQPNDDLSSLYTPESCLPGPSPDEATLKAFHQPFINGCRQTCLVYEDNGTILAHSQLVDYPQYTNISLITAPTARRKGVGSTLMAKAVEQANRAFVIAYCLPHNEPIKTLLIKQGFSLLPELFNEHLIYLIEKN